MRKCWPRTRLNSLSQFVGKWIQTGAGPEFPLKHLVDDVLDEIVAQESQKTNQDQLPQEQNQEIFVQEKEPEFDLGEQANATDPEANLGENANSFMAGEKANATEPEINLSENASLHQMYVHRLQIANCIKRRRK